MELFPYTNQWLPDDVVADLSIFFTMPWLCLKIVCHLKSTESLIKKNHNFPICSL